MSTLSRKKASYHHGDLQAALIRTAGKMLEKEGVEALKLREVARRAGVSHNAPYRHFPQREALLAALATEGFEWLAAAQAKAEDLRGMGEAYVHFALAHPQRFRLMFGGQIPIEKHPHLREVASRTFHGLSGALASRVPEAQGARVASVAAWSLVHGLALLLMGNRISLGERKREAFVRDVLSSIRFVVGPTQPAA
jgi:AcrR family transcriptional regulator